VAWGASRTSRSSCTHRRTREANGPGASLGQQRWLEGHRRQSHVQRVRPVFFTKESQKMVWKTPKIVEVSVGMEINMYACAARK
jgi:coenzyme PQQ precursor peptide PqqA